MATHAKQHQQQRSHVKWFVFNNDGLYAANKINRHYGDQISHIQPTMLLIIIISKRMFSLCLRFFSLCRFALCLPNHLFSYVPMCSSISLDLKQHTYYIPLVFTNRLLGSLQHGAHTLVPYIVYRFILLTRIILPYNNNVYFNCEI